MARVESFSRSGMVAVNFGSHKSVTDIGRFTKGYKGNMRYSFLTSVRGLQNGEKSMQKGSKISQAWVICKNKRNAILILIAFFSSFNGLMTGYAGGFF